MKYSTDMYHKEWICLNLLKNINDIAVLKLRVSSTKYQKK